MLIHNHGQDGASSLPPEAADAASHGDTAPSTGHLDATATAAPTTAATASANNDPIAAGTTGSGPVSTSNAVNATRTASARAANRRNHPRTVSTGRSSTAATARQPAPAAFAASAAPITSARSARRSNATTGSSTCVVPHPRQQARRGRTRTVAAPGPRSTRGLAQPHRDRRHPHPGQLPGGPLRIRRRHGAAANQRTQPRHARHLLIGIQNAPTPRTRRHHQRRSTLPVSARRRSRRGRRRWA